MSAISKSDWPSSVISAPLVNNDLIARDAEIQRIGEAIQSRDSFLIWGFRDVGKTSIVKKAIARLSEWDRKRCIYWSGEASVRDFAGHLVRGLYLAGDGTVRGRIRSDGGGHKMSVEGWFRSRSSGQLKALLYQALAKDRYAFFLDHMRPATQSMAHFWKEIIWRCKTPIYLIARGWDHSEIGYAWSIYYVKQYRIEISPLSEVATRDVLERCIERFGLSRFDLTGFRDEIIRLSRHLPGSVVKMCQLAAQAQYHYGDQIKVNLVHVDYLMMNDPLRQRASQGDR